MQNEAVVKHEAQFLRRPVHTQRSAKGFFYDTRRVRDCPKKQRVESFEDGINRGVVKGPSSLTP